MRTTTVALTIALAAALGVSTPIAHAAAPEGTITWGLHVTPPSTWLDPAETEALATPFMVLYAVHDALAKPMPGNANAPSLAESWTVSRTAARTSSSCARAPASTTAIR